MLFHKHSGSYNGTSCGSGSYYRILRYIQIRLLSLLHNCWIFGTPAILAWSAHGSSRCMHCPMDFLFLNTIALFLPFLLCIDCLCTALLDRCEAPEEPARFFVVLPFPYIRRLPLFPMSATMSKLWSHAIFQRPPLLSVVFFPSLSGLWRFPLYIRIISRTARIQFFQYTRYRCIRMLFLAFFDALIEDMSIYLPSIPIAFFKISRASCVSLSSFLAWQFLCFIAGKIVGPANDDLIFILFILLHPVADGCGVTSKHFTRFYISGIRIIEHVLDDLFLKFFVISDLF